MKAMDGENYRTILGIRFFTGNPKEGAAIGLQGGLVVVPAAPLLIEMGGDPYNREALLGSDLAITDSGLMVLVWNIMNGERITRFSGLEYMKLILDEPALRAPHSTLWVMPTEAAMKKNLEWLNAQGIPTTPEDCYLAPHYKSKQITDPALLEIVKAKKPAHIIMAVGGGVQEKLGYYLKMNAGYRPAIHCTGAAIGFLSGEQVNIPTWADRFFLGWFFRCMSSPRRFIPRYWKAKKLVSIMWKYRDRCPIDPVP